MRRLLIKFTLGQLMGAIAVVAVAFAVMPETLAVGFSVLLFAIALLISVVSAVTAAPKVTVAAWVFSCYPVLLLASLYATWLTAWYALGHRPRPSLDDPKYIGILVDVPHLLTWVLLAGSSPALLTCLVLVIVEVARSASREQNRAARVVTLLCVPTLLWLSVFFVLRLDPGQVLVWFFD